MDIKNRVNKITPTLIGAIDWAKNAPNIPINKKGWEQFAGMTWKQQAEQALINLLTKQYSEPAAAAKRGIEFESSLYAGVDPKIRLGIKEQKSLDYYGMVANAVEGMTYQHKSSTHRRYDWAQMPFYIFGKEDAVRLPLIVDIKTTANYKHGKYLESWQHKLYMLNNKGMASVFCYIVVEWKNEDSYEIENVFVETYRLKGVEQMPHGLPIEGPEEFFEFDQLEVEIENKIQEAIYYMRDNKVNGQNLFGLYRSVFCG